MLEKDRCSGKINLTIIIVIFIIIFSRSLSAEIVLDKIINYNNDLKNSSARFIQNDGRTIEEGVIYFGYERIKLDYFSPAIISLVISNKKGMYVNHELQETQFFNTNKSYIKFFFEMFDTNSFVEGAEIKISNNLIRINKEINIDDNIYEINIIYENIPIKLRKIEVIENNTRIELGLFDHEQLKNLEKKFFSMISPY